MAGWPDFLYRLTPRDEQVTPLEIVTARLTDTQAATTVSTSTYTVPLGKILLLKSALMRGNTTIAGAANLTRATAFMDPSSSDPGVGFKSWVPTAADERNDTVTGLTHFKCSEPGHCDVVVPEGWQIYAQATFDVAVAGNTIDLHITGILIPRGNFAI